MSLWSHERKQVGGGEGGNVSQLLRGYWNGPVAEARGWRRWGDWWEMGAFKRCLLGKCWEFQMNQHKFLE